VTVGLVWAEARGRVIGAGGALPWRLPEDQQLFKALTLGATVVMGRATWESLPRSVRPLPGRRNVVLTRQPDFAAPGAVVASSLTDALATGGDVWVIGGGEVYAAALPHADVAVVTELDLVVDGDTLAPELPDSWRLVAQDPPEGWHLSASGLRYRVRTWRPSAPGHPR